MTEFKTIVGEPSQNPRRDDGHHQWDEGIEAQLERDHLNGWKLLHTTSHTPITTDRYTRPIFYCLLSREDRG